MTPNSAASSFCVSSSILLAPSAIEPHYHRSELNDLLPPNITPAHLSTLLLESAQGYKTTTRNIHNSAWIPPILQKYNTIYTHNSAPFLPPSSAQVHPARARAPIILRTLHQPCTALAPGIRPVHNTAASSCAKRRAKKELSLFRRKHLK